MLKTLTYTGAEWSAKHDGCSVFFETTIKSDFIFMKIVDIEISAGIQMHKSGRTLTLCSKSKLQCIPWKFAHESLEFVFLLSVYPENK